MKDSKSLYNISEDLMELLHKIHEESEETGEVSKDTEELLVISQNELSTKVVGYREVMKKWKGENNAIDEEIARLESLKEYNEKGTERLTAALLQATLLFGQEDKKGIKRLDLGLNKLSTRRSKSIQINDEDEIDDKFKTVTVTLKVPATKIDEVTKTMGATAGLEGFATSSAIIGKTAIKAEIESGIEVSGAEQITKYGLTIK
jgi:hypothetical protein